MSRFLPNSLFGQTVLILLAGLLVSHLIGAWIYAGDRAYAVRAVGGLAMAQRVANLTRLVEDAPPEWRERIVAASSDPAFRIALTAQPPAVTLVGDQPPIARVIRDFLADQPRKEAVRDIRVAVARTPDPPVAMLGRGAMHHHPMRMNAMMHAAGAWRGLQIAVQLTDGQWLSFGTALPDTGPALSWQFVASMAVMALIILAVSGWAVRRVTAPLGAMAAAAQRLGQDVGAPPLAEIGSAEMRGAARAFNEMQDSLRRIIENRTRMLAAISHDLRTPLTLLRLRAETVENAEERDRMLAAIADMEAMIAATLAFARDEAATEPRRPTDLTALLSSIVDELADAGLPVTMAPAASIVGECRPVTMAPAASIVGECRPAALKRALVNLIDNAIKYGKAAHVSIVAAARAVEISIEDEGPGIPEDELVRVLQPFYRIEQSRNPETGGIGLGLAIALAIIQAHGGELHLVNRPRGGLRALVVLPQ